MISNKNLKSNQILEKKFKTEISGYSAREVDEYLDQILEDYRKFEEEAQLNAGQIEDRNITIKQHEEKINILQIELENTLDLLKKAETSKNLDVVQELKVLRRQLDQISKKK